MLCFLTMRVDEAVTDQRLGIRQKRASSCSIGVDCARKGAQSNRPFVVVLRYKAVLCAGGNSENVLLLLFDEFFARAFIGLCAQRER